LVSVRYSQQIFQKETPGNINMHMSQEVCFQNLWVGAFRVCFPLKENPETVNIFWHKTFYVETNTTQKKEKRKEKGVINLLEQKLNRILWSGKDEKAKAKVSWEKICVPKKEGGLGLKRIGAWNKAAMLRHIWNLFDQSGISSPNLDLCGWLGCRRTG
jgi:hypothetical protein